MENLKLRDYQAELVDKILCAYNDGYRRILACLATGGGKSVIIGELANMLGGRTLILTHRVEILEQNSRWLYRAGILSAKKNTVGISTETVVAMVETLDSRIKRHGIGYIGEFDTIILDEVHINVFKKVFSKYRPEKIIGFTATPVTNRKETMKRGEEEYTRRLAMSKDFDVLIQGISTKGLIEQGFLVQDYNISLVLPNFDGLRESNSHPDGYTSNSLNKVYNNRVAMDVLYEAIEKHCKGKKTLIFNSTTANNQLVYEGLEERGYNVQMFDSVNKSDMTRKEVVEWFRDEREAILVGTNVFTTGFDVTDIEVVIVNRATKSLSLWLQMVGRGARITDKIFKSAFVVIDLGQNIETHGLWSQERDWNEYFAEQPWKLKRKKQVQEVWTCSHCDGLTPTGEVMDSDGLQRCGECGAVREFVPRGDNGIDKTGTLVPRDAMPVPKGPEIVKYVRKIGRPENALAFQILEKQILDLFITHEVTYRDYQSRYERYKKRVTEIYTKAYFQIIREQLEGDGRRLDTSLKRIQGKIDKHYKIEK